MKNLWLFLFLLLFPSVFFAQKTLTGLWTGTLSNDSLTVRKDQNIELVLSQYKQEVTGYSRVTFMVNDTLYNIVRSVKGTINGDICEVEDDDIISHNFPIKPAKKVKTIYTFIRKDSIWRMSGDWHTNKTKRYYSISGNIELKEEPDMNNSKLIPHLEELNMANNIPFYKEKKEEEQRVLAAQKRKNQTAAQKPTTVPVEATKNDIAAVKEEPKEKATPAKAPAETAASTKPAEENKPIVVQPPSPSNKPLATSSAPVAKTTELKNPAPAQPTPAKPVKTETIAAAKPETKAPVTVNKTESKPQTDIPAVVTRPVEEKKEIAIAEKKPEPPVIKETTKPAIPVAAIKVNERTTVSSQTVTFKSDSLQLALYDNGEVDGDTVSVLLNGEIIIAKQGLKTSAIRKTIYIEPGKDEITLLLYAENLGKYPPNTGLLMVYDGDDRYQVRFSADLQQNAAVIFKRKK